MIDGAIELVVEVEGELVPVSFPGGATGAIQAGPGALERVVGEAGLPRPDALLVAPFRPRKIVAIGLNYMDHIRETGMEPPRVPLVFAKFPSSVVGPDAAITIPTEVTQRVDWEVELGVVIGSHAYRVSRERALEHVFGYTVANDVSARDLQFGDGQWVRGKSLDTFCPVGPLVVTRDEVPDPQVLNLRTRVNGQTVQDSSTSEMIFGVAELIEFCSASFSLDPGDLLLTGTPWGCGEFMSPQRSLQPGDVVETEVDGIGTLRNPVEAARREAAASK
ncbi:MAG TPA: fumarylacetoacetate hydrolase family protein [Solirubrobacteraceae bacterium]|nr:fumarylacetoacetate hydrolase family protein [Solirubrobacteraceae bacterium]